MRLKRNESFTRSPLNATQLKSFAIAPRHETKFLTSHIFPILEGWELLAKWVFHSNVENALTSVAYSGSCTSSLLVQKRAKASVGMM